jgi:hypothetical protein
MWPSTLEAVASFRSFADSRTISKGRRSIDDRSGAVSDIAPNRTTRAAGSVEGGGRT